MGVVYTGGDYLKSYEFFLSNLYCDVVVSWCRSSSISLVRGSVWMKYFRV